jgi:hypothetical protein
MTKRSSEDLDRLERGLARTYSTLAPPELGPQWAANVMRDIRREAAQAQAVHKRDGWVALRVWRTAALAAGFALIFAGSLFLSGEVEVEKGELAAVLSEELEPSPALLE